MVEKIYFIYISIIPLTSRIFIVFGHVVSVYIRGQSVTQRSMDRCAPSCIFHWIQDHKNSKFSGQNISSSAVKALKKSFRGYSYPLDLKILILYFLKMMVSIRHGNVNNNPLGVLVQKHFIADHVTRDHEDD